MKEYQKLIYIFIILFLVSGCKILEKKATEIKNSFGKQSSEESINKKNKCIKLYNINIVLHYLFFNQITKISRRSYILFYNLIYTRKIYFLYKF